MSSWTVMISGACTRHAHKPLSENLPACRRRGGKFRVFSAFFEEKPGNRRLSRHYFAISGRSLSCGGVRPDAPSDPARSGVNAPAPVPEADDGGIRPAAGCRTAVAASARWAGLDAPSSGSRAGMLLESRAGRSCGRVGCDAAGSCGRVRVWPAGGAGGSWLWCVGLNAGEPQPVVGAPRPCNDVPAVTYSPTPSRVQYHRRCGS